MAAPTSTTPNKMGSLRRIRMKYDRRDAIASNDQGAVIISG
jgi:hypothetical protein